MNFFKCIKTTTLLFVILITQTSYAYLTSGYPVSVVSGKTYTGSLGMRVEREYQINFVRYDSATRYRNINIVMTALNKGVWHVDYAIDNDYRLRKYCNLSRDYRTVTCNIPINSLSKERSRNFYVRQARYYYPQKYALKITLTGAYNYSHPRGIGDLVARDLAVKYAGSLGHIAMWDGLRILEVTNLKHNAVRKISFTSFLGTSHSLYWGARYGKGSYRQRKRATTAGWEQRKFDPEYVFRGSFREGKYIDRWKLLGLFSGRTFSTNLKNYYSRRYPFLRWQKVKRIQRAQFRCDSFVDYSYRKAGIRLSYIMAPKLLFNSMPRKR